MIRFVNIILIKIGFEIRLLYFEIFKIKKIVLLEIIFLELDNDD